MVGAGGDGKFDLLFRRHARMGTLIDAAAAAAATPPDDRQARPRDPMARPRPGADRARRPMAERLVDRPEAQAFGQVEFGPRDRAPDLAAASHQAALQAGKQRGTQARALSAPTGPPTPASWATAPRPG